MWEEEFKVGDLVRLAQITGDYDFVRSRRTDEFLGHVGKIISSSNGMYMLYGVEFSPGEYVSCKQEWLELADASKIDVTSDDLMELLE